MFRHISTLLIYYGVKGAQEPQNGEIKNEVDGKSCSLDCKNGGICEYLNLGDKYEPHCKCKRGWTGETCSTCLGRLESEATNEIQTIHDGYGNYSSSYQAKCSWLIKAPAHPDESKQYFIELNVTSFETECGWDHLYVFDGTSAYDSTLIAALCGIMKSPPTLYAASGYAFLHFYSDMAYNMSGFNIDYRLVEEVVESSLSLGGAMLPMEPFGTWTDRKPFPADMANRASPSAIAHDEIIYIWGGYQFKQNDDEIDNKMWKYSTRSGEFHSTASRRTPVLRYGAPITLYDSKYFILYGGVTYPNHSLLSDVWRYNISTDSWDELISGSVKPLELSGHSLLTVQFPNGTERVISLGGYAPHYGYTSLLQEFTISTRDFQCVIPFTFGRRIPGSYGHVAIVDQSSPWTVYIYAGYQNNVVSDSLTLYDSVERTFYELPPSKRWGGSNRWFHSGSQFGDQLVFFSGNSHNDTTQSAGSLCYSDEIIIYSIKCKEWKKMTTSIDWYPRYGAISLTVNNLIYTIGGFNGQLLSDIIMFEPSAELSTSHCQITREDDTCPTDDLNLDIKETEKALLMSTSCSYCTYPNMLSNTHCQYCSSNTDITRPCSSGLPNSSSRGGVCKSDVTNCDDFATYSCMASHKKCASCVLSGCVFQVTKDSTKKDKSDQMTCVDRAGQAEIPNSTELSTDSYSTSFYNDTEMCTISNNVDLFECGTFSNCTECTKHHNCMWCGSLNVCVSNEAYVTSFPFGQCFEWFQRQNCQRTMCEGHLTCKTCQSDPRCGWCDDGTMTGSGTCKDGTLETDNERQCNPMDNVPRWYWIKCPVCNCSGHSKCDTGTNECLDCQSNTYGKNCERCLEGYYGIALNKGNCTKCECGKHGKSCNHVTGKCACTTKGITGDNCNKCDAEYKGNAENGTCYYKVIPDFQYSFRMKPDVDKEVTKLNCQITPEKEEPDIEITVKTQKDEEKVRVNITTYLNGEAEELVISSNATNDFHATVSVKDYQFGTKTNRSIRIYIYDFSTPLVIKVSVTQQASMNLLTFFLVFFACFLSLLLIAVIAWKVKTMYDVYLQRRAVLNEMREMAARPFAQVQLNTQDSPLLDEQPQPVCYEILEDNSAAVATVFMLLPRNEDGSPPIGHSSLCFGSVMISFDEKTEQDLLLPILPNTTTQTRGDGVDNPTCMDVTNTSPS